MSERVNGPYKHRKLWRVHITISNGGKSQTEYRSFATEDEAKKFKRAVEREIFKSKDAKSLREKAERLQKLADHYVAQAERRDGRELTLEAAMEKYGQYMREDKGNKESSVTTTMYRLRAIFGDCTVSVTSVNARKAATLYDERRQQVRAATHHKELARARAFMEWCKERGWITRNPFAKVKSVGKASRGKEQLRLAETRRFAEVARDQASKDERHMCHQRELGWRESALAVLIALYLGLRASEVIGIRRRDVDDGGRLLWIPDSKTEAGRRTLEVAADLRPLLWRRASECTEPTQRLFPHHRSWVLYHVKRLCRAAGVPEITAHGARGTHATIAAQMGTTSHVVAKALGHTNTTITHQHYIRPGTVEQVARNRLAEALNTAEAAEEQFRGDEAPAQRETKSTKTVSQALKPADVSHEDWLKVLKSLGFQASQEETPDPENHQR